MSFFFFLIFLLSAFFFVLSGDLVIEWDNNAF